MPRTLKARGLVKGVRYGDLGEGVSRLILTGKGPFAVDKLDVLKNDDGNGYRIAIDMSAASEREFDAALANQALTTGSTVSTDKGGRVGTGPISNPGHRFTVVIDPGHGGIDGGAEGLNGTIEKNVTLAFATELRDKLAAVGNYDVFMTRDTDEFLRLDDRVRIARQHEADLFISIHADTISVKGIRGATVYTVSDKASDPEAQALADRENLSDQFAGMEIKDDNKEVTDILIDLIRRETHNFSMSFAHTLVGELSTSVGLINNPQRSAGFKVLKAPDVPSVLVELGYLSNAKDEEQLLNADWRGKAAQSITNAVALFAAAKTGREPEADMAGRRLQPEAALHDDNTGAFISGMRMPKFGRCRILSTWWRHGFSITDWDRLESLRERRLRLGNSRTTDWSGHDSSHRLFLWHRHDAGPSGRGGRGDLHQPSVEGSARLRGAGQVRAAGDDAHPCVRRLADGRICARTAPVSADPGDSGSRQGGLPVGRGQELLQPPRHRRDRPWPRHHRQSAEFRLGQAPGRRLDDHPAGGEELPAVLGPDLRAQDQGDDPRLPHRAGLFEGPHPRTLPQRDLLRLRRLWRRRRGADLFRQVGRTN